MQPPRTRRSVIPDDYLVYLQEIEVTEGISEDPITFEQAMKSEQSNLWHNKAMVDELKFMQINNVWTLVHALENVKAIGCKWVPKTKKDSVGKIERYRARLVAKGFTQTKGID